MRRGKRRREKKEKRSVAGIINRLTRKHTELVNGARELTRRIEDENYTLHRMRFDPPKGLLALVVRDRMAKESRAA